MKRSVTWAAIVQADIERMHYRDAERVCMAVFAFAKDGSGLIERVDPHNPYHVRVRAKGGVALVTFDEKSVLIWRIFGTVAVVRPAR